MTTEIKMPKHPPANEIAEAEIDVDEFLIEMAPAIKEAIPVMREHLRAVGVEDESFAPAFLKELYRGMFPLMRQAFAMGVESERKRCMDWLLEKKAYALMLDLAEGLPAGDGGMGTMQDALRRRFG